MRAGVTMTDPAPRDHRHQREHRGGRGPRARRGHPGDHDHRPGHPHRGRQHHHRQHHRASAAPCAPASSSRPSWATTCASGPFAHLRPGARVGDAAEVGNYAEIKAATLGARSKQHHFSYLGDAEIGEGVNIGAGTITANYDGQRKHRTVIGDGAFIGSDTIIRAPVTIGEGSVTGAGSVVTHDVPAGHHRGGRARRDPTSVARTRHRDLMDLLPELLIIAALIVLNGVFVAAEISLVTVRRSRLQQLIDEGSKGAARVDRLVANPGRFLAVVQLAITFIGFLAAAVAGANTAAGAGARPRARPRIGGGLGVAARR